MNLSINNPIIRQNSADYSPRVWTFLMFRQSKSPSDKVSTETYNTDKFILDSLYRSATKVTLSDQDIHDLTTHLIEIRDNPELFGELSQHPLLRLMDGEVI